MFASAAALLLALTGCSRPAPPGGVVGSAAEATEATAVPQTPLGTPCAHERECPGSDLCVEGFCAADRGPEPVVSPRVEPVSPPCTPWRDEDVLEAVRAGRSRGDALFEWGAMSAAVRSDRATLWTRTEEPARIRVQYSAGPECPTEVTPWLRTERAGDLAIQLELEGLTANTRYRYALEVEGSGVLSTAGFFRTLPEHDAPFRLALGADLSSRSSMHGLIDELATSGADLLLWLGDWPYADSSPAARSLDQFRGRHLASRRALPVQQLMRAMPIHAVWDDHEVTDDWDALTAKSSPELVANGTQAWREFFPVRDAPPGEIYRRYGIGPGLEVFHLDLRSHRDANGANDSPQRTMLGAQQRDWLLEGLRESTATFKLVLTSVPLDYGTTGRDHWAGFATERDQLLEAISEARLEGVVFLSGDQHWLAVHHLPQGHKLFQTGALAQTPRRPRARVPPEVVMQHMALSYGLLDYDPGPPARLTFTGIGNARESRKDTGDPVELYRETVLAGAGRIYLESPGDASHWRLDGAHTFVGHGPAELLLAPPGDYRLTWRSQVPGLEPPPEQRFTLRAGGKMTLSAPAVPELPEGVWLADFADDDALDGWTVVEECGEGRGDWQVVAGALEERGNCFDRDDEPADREAARAWRAKKKHLRPLAAARRGTWLQAPGVTMGNEGTLGVRVTPHDNDGFGLMYGIEGSGPQARYYRVSFDPQREFVRLVRHDGGGRFVVLAEDRRFELALRHDYRLSVERRGARHAVWLDDELVLEADDATLGADDGGVALYSWGMERVVFDALFVAP